MSKTHKKGEIVAGFLAPHPPHARLLSSTKRRAQVAQEPTVDPGDTDVDLLGHTIGPRRILGPDRSGEAVGCVVGQTNSFFL